jgi:TatD DNase family protein
VTDTHAHLDALDDPDAAIERARQAGVTRIVTVGTGIDSCRKAVSLADRHDGVYAALGIDPHQAATAEAARLGELRELLHHPKAVAVGETGLDYFHRFASPEEQRTLFEGQLELADELRKPVVIHSRDASADTAAVLDGFAGTVVLHCFSEPDLQPAAAQRRYYVSFAGNVTYPKASELRTAAATVALDRVLVETDTPYLAPQPLRGKPNEPAHLTYTVEVLGTVLSQEPVDLATLLDANAVAAFGFPA